MGLQLIVSVITSFYIINETAAVVDRDGNWGQWAYPFPCSKSCNGGERKKVRLCNLPAPTGNGTLCSVDGEEKDKQWATEKCNEISCFIGEYTDWSVCLPDCTWQGTHTKYALCGTERCDESKYPPITEKCNSWNKTTCPDPCLTKKCPQYSSCEDESTEEKENPVCECQLGYTMNSDKTTCIRPPPVKPTPRPIPVLPPAQKTVATVISKTASTVLIVFVSITLLLFLLLRIFSPDRIIQMNMEIALLCAHIFLVFPPETTENEVLCKIVSICIHFFFTACYIFIMLEALHMYSLVAYVVKKDGMLTNLQNILIGWCLAGFIVLLSVCFEYEHYGGEYHCWLQMNTPLLYAHIVPAVIFVILTLTLIEAAGSSDNLKPLKQVDIPQRTSAKFSQRTNLIIIPFMVTHWILGMLAEYEQNLALYGTFSIVNGIFGGLVFFLHSSNNQQVRNKLKSAWNSVRGRSSR